MEFSVIEEFDIGPDKFGVDTRLHSISTLHAHIAHESTCHIVDETSGACIISWAQTRIDGLVKSIVGIEHEGGFRSIKLSHNSTLRPHRNLIHHKDVIGGESRSLLHGTHLRNSCLVEAVGFDKTGEGLSQADIELGVIEPAIAILVHLYPCVTLAHLPLCGITCSKREVACLIEMWRFNLKASLFKGHHVAIDNSVLHSWLNELGMEQYLLLQSPSVCTGRSFVKRVPVHLAWRTPHGKQGTHTGIGRGIL